MASTAEAQVTPRFKTLRYDLPQGELATFRNELALDYFFPPIPSEIINTRFNLTFETETSPGSFDAADIGLILQPPIDDPNADDERVLTLFRTGADFGWSGTGTFTFDEETDILNGRVLDAPPDAFAMLYAVVLFHADRLTDPKTLDPLGGRFVDSYIEVDYIAIPEPSTVSLWFIAAVGLVSQVLWRQRSFRRFQRRDRHLDPA